MMRGFCLRGFCPEGAYVLMELCMEGVLSGGGFVRRGFCPTFFFPLSSPTTVNYPHHPYPLSLLLHTLLSPRVDGNKVR